MSGPLQPPKLSAMATVTVTRTLSAPPHAVFDTLTVAGRYPGYTPYRWVEMERLGEGEPDGAGAIRALHLAGPPLRERVIVHERPRRFVFEVLSGAPGIRSYAGTQTFEPDGAGTRVSYRIEFEPLVPGTALPLAAALRGAVEVLMLLAGREAPRRAADEVPPLRAA